VIAKIPKGASSEDKDKVDDFIEQLASLTGTRVPENFVIEFLEATRRGDVTYDNFIERCNKEISKEVLGATLGIEEGSKGQGSYAHSATHSSLMEVYTFFDEVMIAQSINNQLIRRLIDFNFFNVREYPVFSFKHDWFADIIKIAQGLESLTRMGVGIPVDWIYARTGIPKPKSGETITEVVEKALLPGEKGIDNKAKNIDGFSSPSTPLGVKFADDRRELNYFEKRGQFVQQEKMFDRLEADALNAGAAVIDKIFNKVLKSVSKKIESQLGKQLISIPKFAIDISGFRDILTESSLAMHLMGYYYAGKEVNAENFQEDIEIGFIRQAVESFKKKIPRGKSWYEKITKTYDERYFHVAGLTKADIEKIFNNSLIALEDGWSMQEFESVISRMKIEYTGEVYGKDLTGEPLKASHLKVIFRNNMMKSYRDGKNKLYNDPDVSDTIWGYTYSAVLDDRVRPSHAKLDGITRRKEDIFWQRYDPPWDHNCRCVKFAVLKSDIANGIASPTPDGKMPKMNLAEG